MRYALSFSVSVLVLGLTMASGFAATPSAKDTKADAVATCKDLPSYETLKSALIAARKDHNGGLGNDMWGAIVDRTGVVCAIAYTGTTVDAQWPGSRVIAVQKANTANAFSTAKSALSTANLYTGAQPNGFLYGIQESNPVDVKVAYIGPFVQYGKKNDPMVGHVLGGVNVFGGGLALYNNTGKILGGLGVSGDTSCADHNIAWRMRNTMRLDYVPGGVSPDKNDQVIYDIHLNNSTSGFGHPQCLNDEHKIADDLPKTSIVNPPAAPTPEPAKSVEPVKPTEPAKPDDKAKPATSAVENKK